MKQLLSILLIMLLFCSCASKTKIKEVPVRTVERIEERLVPVPLPADSSAIIALFECDSFNNVIMHQLNEAKSKRTETSHSFKEGQFKYRVKTIRDTIYIPSKTIYTTIEIPFRVEIPVVEYRLRWYYRYLSWAGAISLFGLALWGASKINFKSLFTIILKIFK